VPGGPYQIRAADRASPTIKAAVSLPMFPDT
jgi:hypothetical protein